MRKEHKEVTSAVALPWMMFFLLMMIYLFTIHDIGNFVWAFVGSCGLLALTFFVIGMVARHKVFITIGFLCMLSVASATLLGRSLYNEYILPCDRLDASDTVFGANPTSGPKDASVFEFLNGTFIDTDRTLGYELQGEIYCVAPIVQPVAWSASVYYYAAGVGCCEKRTNFNCGVIEGTMTAIDVNKDLGVYQRAVKQAQAVYGIAPQEKVHIVYTVKSVDEYRLNLWNTGMFVGLLATIFDFILCSIAGLYLARVLLLTSKKETAIEADLADVPLRSFSEAT